MILLPCSQRFLDHFREAKEVQVSTQHGHWPVRRPSQSLLSCLHQCIQADRRSTLNTSFDEALQR